MFVKLNNSSCAVALYSERNCATEMYNNATTNATESATYDLIALSARVLRQSQSNQPRNSNATNQLRSNATSATAGISNATIQSIKDKQNIHKLKWLIAKYGSYYDATKQDLVDEFDGATEAQSIEICLTTYENVVTNLRKINPGKYNQFKRQTHD